jgi:hypothetical protein
MTIGILNLILYIPQSNSLKAKRQVLHSLKANLRNSFNIAVAQIGDEDKWQKAKLAIVGVEKNRETMNSSLSRIINFIENFNQVELINHDLELI